GGQTRYAQTEPNIEVNCGFRRIWEADRAGHLTARVFVTGFLQEQIDLLQVWIHHKWCHNCDQRKPYRTSFASRWHRCMAAHQRVYCGVHGAELAWNGMFSRTRRCSCGTGTTHIDDV
ncbi:MAG: hypothetical protein ABI193_20470, partial [Minicystis sp.]